MVYHAIIHPHLTYCITIWGGACSSTLLPLFRLQKKVVRIMTFSPFISHSTPIFCNLKILPLEYIYKYNLGLTFYKINNSMVKVGTHNLISICSIHKHETRLSTSNNFFQKFNRTQIGQSTYTAKGLQFWRELPPEFKTLPLSSFKYQVKQHLFNLLENTLLNQ